jgi:hypothetical protein
VLMMMIKKMSGVRNDHDDLTLLQGSQRSKRSSSTSISSRVLTDDLAADGRTKL